MCYYLLFLDFKNVFFAKEDTPSLSDSDDNNKSKSEYNLGSDLQNKDANFFLFFINNERTWRNLSNQNV